MFFFLASFAWPCASSSLFFFHFKLILTNHLRSERNQCDLFYLKIESKIVGMAIMKDLIIKLP